MKKGFKHLGTHPDLEKCMQYCPDYALADGPEKERLNKIVEACVQHIRDYGEVTDAQFDALVRFLFLVCHFNVL